MCSLLYVHAKSTSNEHKNTAMMIRQPSLNRLSLTNGFISPKRFLQSAMKSMILYRSIYVCEINQ